MSFNDARGSGTERATAHQPVLFTFASPDLATNPHPEPLERDGIRETWVYLYRIRRPHAISHEFSCPVSLKYGKVDRWRARVMVPTLQRDGTRLPIMDRK